MAEQPSEARVVAEQPQAVALAEQPSEGRVVVGRPAAVALAERPSEVRASVEVSGSAALSHLEARLVQKLTSMPRQRPEGTTRCERPRSPSLRAGSTESLSWHLLPTKDRKA